MNYFAAISSILRNQLLYSTRNSSCQLKYSQQNINILDIYWINLEISQERRMIMQNYLQYYGLSNHYRIRGITPNQIMIPPDIARPARCRSITKNQTLEIIQDIKIQNQLQHQQSDPTKKAKSSHHSSGGNRTILITSHCGRPKNTIKELAVTLSHLMTLHKALHSHKSHSQEYLLVLEDDLQLAIEINFSELIAQAPSDFIILQLVTSNFYIIQHLWKFYSNKKQLFIKRKENDDYWCAGAYLIHKKRFLKLFSLQLISKVSEKIYLANMIAGYHRPSCVPNFCCNVNQSSSFFSNYEMDTACIKSPRGYQADNFIFALALEHTYILTVPLFVNTKVGNISTLHQEHVSVHHLAFNQTKGIIKDLFLYDNPNIPSFVNRNCVLNFSSEVLI